MEFRNLIKGRALYTEREKIWIAQGMKFFAIDYSGIQVTKQYWIGSTQQRIAAYNRVSRQLFREGIHHLVPLLNGDIFLTTKRKAYTLDSSGQIKSTFSSFIGNKPAHQGVCVTPEGTLFFGEYSVNLDHKNTTTLYRSVDNGINFVPVLVFPKNIRHIHFVKYDPYSHGIWLGTGDADHECNLMLSKDNGDTWEVIGGGSQDWRAIGVCIIEDSLIWGTDAGSVPDINHIVKMDRKTKQLELLSNVEGPCHGCAKYPNGKILISTGVEGGENEQDRFSRLKMIKNDEVIEVFKREKDILPLIIQYGVIRLPLGSENSRKVIFTSMGLKGGGEVVVLGEY
jgi:hypothetical protein